MIIPLPYIIIALSCFVVALCVWQFVMWRKWRIIFKGENGASLEKVIETQVVKTKKIEGEIRRQLDEILKIKEDHQDAFQKVRMMRFNSIEEAGANQSFALVALDGNNDGVILTSLYLGNAPRLFIKPIAHGTCAQKLSPEEEKILHDTLTQ